MNPKEMSGTFKKEAGEKGTLALPMYLGPSHAPGPSYAPWPCLCASAPPMCPGPAQMSCPCPRALAPHTHPGPAYVPWPRPCAVAPPRYLVPAQVSIDWRDRKPIEDSRVTAYQEGVGVDECGAVGWVRCWDLETLAKRLQT